VSLRRKLSIVALVYVIEGFPMGVFMDVWPVFLARVGVSKAEIGFVSGLSIAWSLKVLWSPLVDRFGERRGWIAGALLAMAACLLALVPAEGPELTAVLWVAFASYCLASATQDIAIDAYTIGLVDRGEEGPVNAMRITAYRVGMLAAGTGLLFLPRWVGWPGTFTAAAGLSLAMAAALRWTPRVEVPLESRRELWGSLARWLGRPGALPVLLFVLLYRVGDSAMGPMVKPFWVERGFSNEEIATVSTFLGILATIAGGWFGGGVVSRVGIGAALLGVGVLALASNLGYAAAAAFPASGRPGVYAASLVESFCAGMAGVAFMSFLMRICQKQHAAVQYALLTAIYNLAGSLLRMVSGLLTEQLGYAGFFALTAAFALPAFAFLPGARRWLAATPP
jgi:PAT family beta-lactamase induction signal transducer AmpG